MIQKLYAYLLPIKIGMIDEPWLVWMHQFRSRSFTDGAKWHPVEGLYREYVEEQRTGDEVL